MRPLTARQTEVLELIKTTMLETGMPPTRAEIARQLGFRSANAAEEHLKALARKGVIEILPGTSRGIKLNIPLDNDAQEEEGACAVQSWRYVVVRGADGGPDQADATLAQGPKVRQEGGVDLHRRDRPARRLPPRPLFRGA